ncbi:MAG TPA: hypothetical protein VG734_17685 [Lacunisphaera sp.]|nr:hypothetical protein [Lacunisphaera sp.]
MRKIPGRLLMVLGVLAAGLPGARGAQFTLFKSVWGDVVVATDVTREGRAVAPPTLDQPVYYRGLSLGNKLGNIPGDRLPDVEETNKFVAKVLAQQGYRGARTGVHEPSLFIIIQWGYLDPRIDDLAWFLGYNASRDIGAQTNPTMLGPEVFLRNFRTRTIETVLDCMKEPIYGIIVTAFDYKSWRTDTPIIYWQSRIGLPANGKSMAEAVPTMVLAAGPSIGHESDGPVLHDADSARAGRVELGELKILDVVNDPVKPASQPGSIK